MDDSDKRSVRAVTSVQREYPSWGRELLRATWSGNEADQ